MISSEMLKVLIADNQDASDGVMRCVKEGRDSLQRALKAQAADN